MGMYTWLSEIEFMLYSGVTDTDVNEALQEVRTVMPEWYIKENIAYKKRFLKRPIETTNYTVYQRIRNEEVRYQSSAYDKRTVLNLLYGLYMGYNKGLMTEDEKIEIWIAQMMKTNPIKLAQWALLIIGKDIAKSNASDFTLKQEFTPDDGIRYEVELKGIITKI